MYSNRKTFGNFPHPINVKVYIEDEKDREHAFTDNCTISIHASIRALPTPPRRLPAAKFYMRRCRAPDDGDHYHLARFEIPSGPRMRGMPGTR